LPDASVDMILMFLSFHHVPDRAAAAKEIGRVLKPGGRLVLRSTFRDRVPDHWWRGFFPRSHAVEEAMFPSEAEVVAIFEAAGFKTAEVVHEEIPFEGDIAEAVALLKLRAVSTFEHLTEVELDEGFARMDAALAAGTIEEKSTFGDFIVFERLADPADPSFRRDPPAEARGGPAHQSYAVYSGALDLRRHKSSGRS
jgi:SAM-dependent methyltransferase